MLPLQTILIFTDRPVQLTVHIMKVQDAKFSSEISVFDPEFDSNYSYLVPISGIYISADEAFDAAVKWITNWLRAKQQIMRRINNPCNCEFLSAKDQVIIFKRYGIEIPVEVNG